jgi:glyoxylase-like metal-dependent hydrolase (beta-lactamase superfamily II)
MREIAPGLFHWVAEHPKIHIPVSSYYVADSETVIDPMVPPEEGLDWFRTGREPSALVVTNRHHHREAPDFMQAFGIEALLVPESGLHEYEGKDIEVRGYAIGEEMIPGIVCHEVGGICPDDMALELRSHGALALADGLMHYGGELNFVPDDYMDEPEQTKRALLESFRRLLDVDFDILLFAHGDPLAEGAKDALRGFVEARPG